MALENLNAKPTGFNPKWITDGIDDKCIQFMEDFGYALCDKKNPKDRYPGRSAVTISQIRNIFGEVKRIEVKLDREGTNWNDLRPGFRMLKPKIAYAAARVIAKRKSSKMNEFKDLLERAHSEVNENHETFLRFSQLLEGIIAYHKVYGGRDN